MRAPYRGLMIYLLVEDSRGYDDCDRPIFGHSDRNVVEGVLRKLEQHHRYLIAFAKELQEELDKFYKDNPVVGTPELKKLPARELVWQENAWKNAYMIEWEKQFDENRIRLSKLSDELIATYGQTHNLSAKDLSDIFHHVDEITYSISEVEDNPNQLP